MPVTAIPTFLEPSAILKLPVTYMSGAVEEFEQRNTDALREKLTALVTEEANPRNVLNIARVDVFLPAELLERGVVLIDTPGVGSTHRHQTAAADAVLPECDAALLVVSADPPITEVEIDYLSRIRQTVARLIIVLNKIDMIEPHEREKTASFLRTALVDHAVLDPFTPIFSLSARDALRARESGDAEESNDQDAASIFSETLTQMIAEPVAATLRSIEQTREALTKAMDVVASASDGEGPEQLPKPTGMPMMAINEISQTIVVEKPRLLSLLGAGVLTSHVRRKLESEYDRTLLDFLSLYANRLRRWMEQSINALRNAFSEFADIHRTQVDAASVPGLPDTSTVQNDLRVLREWNRAEEEPAIQST